jgi:dihydroorotase-like cyclic amidohydrolase
MVVTHVSVIPVNTNTVINNVDVFITNGMIEKIVESGTQSKNKDYKIVEGKGKFLVPGMADMHCHFPGKESTIDRERYYKLQLAAGVTTLRSMRGEESQLATRDSVNKHLKIAPTIYVSYVFPSSDSLLNKDKIDSIVFNAKLKKYDFIKYLGGLKPKNMDLLVADCYSYKIPIAGHAYNKSLKESIDRDFISIEHFQPVLDAYEKDPEAFGKTVDQLKLKGIAVCPTLSFYDVFSFANSKGELEKRNGMNFVDVKTKEIWSKEYDETLNSTKEKMKENFEGNYVNAYKAKFEAFNKALKQLADADALVLLSPDDGAFNVPGFSVAEEMKLYAKAGLSNYQILKIVTWNASVFFHTEKTVGTIENGKKANLVLLNANPLENIENIEKVEGTIVNGTFYSQKQLLGIK